MILLEILLLHRILIYFIYFIGSTMTLSKLTGSIFGPFKVGHSWPLPWNFLAPSDALYGLTIGHVGTKYVPV